MSAKKKTSLIAPGEKNLSAKLTESDVREILRKFKLGLRNVDIVRDLKLERGKEISARTVGEITGGKHWKHIKREG